MSATRRPGGTQRIPSPAARRPAGQPVWSAASTTFGLSDVLARVSHHQARLADDHTPRSDERVSAVLVALADGPDGAEVLLTRRSEKLSSHKGEISFPGGRVDPDEDITSAARREAQEEVGLQVHPSAVHGRLSSLSTFVSKSYIVPVVAAVETKPALSLHDAEVDRAFWIPLRELAAPDVFEWEWWSFYSATDTERPMFFFYLHDETVWGATARVLHELLCVVHGVDHREPG
jgi:8-oxo-dGTP pyrophosphatase MutT (NUDIX family)